MSLVIKSADRVASDDPVLLGWQEQVRTAAREGRPLRVCGGGSKAFYGRPVAGEPLDATVYRGVVAYEPTELVITARGGTPLAEVESLLAERGQMLACEPPRFSAATTVGGAVAAGLSGPRRMAAGALRDFVLGVRLLDGRSELLSFGGQVMKNVAGYDVSRLLAGSLGCLGVLAEVSLKVVPRPREERTLRFEFAASVALERLHRWAGQALPLSASAWQQDVLHLRLSGAAAAVAAAQQKLGGESLAAAEGTAFWTRLRDQTHDYFSPAAAPEATLFRLALPDIAPSLVLPGPQLIEWGGAQRWCRSDAEQLQKIRAIATSCGGHATVFRAPAGSSPDEVFTPLPAPLWRLHRELKSAFDPAGVFNRGRMYREL